MDQPKIEGLDKIEGSHVKMKGNIMLKGRPCQVTKVSFAKPGKHGHVKCNIVGKDLLMEDKKYQHMCTGHAEIYVPKVLKYALIISDLEVEQDGKTRTVTGIECMTDDDNCDQVTLNMKEGNPQFEEAVKLFREEGEDKEIVIQIIQCSVGEPGKYSWEHTIEKVSSRED